MMSIEDLEVVAGLLNVVLRCCDFEVDTDFIYIDGKYSKIKALPKGYRCYYASKNACSFYLKRKG